MLSTLTKKQMITSYILLVILFICLLYSATVVVKQQFFKQETVKATLIKQVTKTYTGEFNDSEYRAMINNCDVIEYEVTLNVVDDSKVKHTDVIQSLTKVADVNDKTVCKLSLSFSDYAKGSLK